MLKSGRYLWWVLGYCLLIWSVVPLLRVSLPMDTQEALVWGKFCLWGTTKHPPFSGWVAYGVYQMFASFDGVMYLLSQLCVALGVFYIYRLARCLTDEKTAVAASLLQFGIIYYHFSAVEFNVNVVSLALWPMCVYYFWKAYNEDHLNDWLLFGLLAGVNVLNKYVSVMLFASVGVFVCVDKGLWRLCKNYKAYMAVLVGLAVVAPHLWWLYENDFESFNYISSRSHGGTLGLWGHVVYPLKFLAAQLLFALPALITYAIFYQKFQRGETAVGQRAGLLVGIMTVVPILLFMINAIITGNALKSMWGFPCLFMWGTALCCFWPLKWQEDMVKKLAVAMGCWITLAAVIYAVQCLTTTSPRFVTNVHKVTEMLENKWIDKMGKTPEYVAAGVWYGDMLALYGKGDIKPMIWMSPKNNPWFDRDDFRRKGALVVAENENEYEQYLQEYGKDMSEMRKLTIEFKNYFGKTKSKDIFYGFYLPTENENER